MMLLGESSRVVADRVKDGLAEIQKTLPPGVKIEALYDRKDLVNRTILRVSRNLIEGGILVIAVLLLLLGSFRAGLLVSVAIPLSMLVAVTGMVQAKISGNLMSLGAIDFGLIVDGSVVIVENILRRLHQRRPEESVEETIRKAGSEVAKPIFFGVISGFVNHVPRPLTFGLADVCAARALSLSLYTGFACGLGRSAQDGIKCGQVG